MPKPKRDRKRVCIAFTRVAMGWWQLIARPLENSCAVQRMYSWQSGSLKGGCRRRMPTDGRGEVDAPELSWNRQHRGSYRSGRNRRAVENPALDRDFDLRTCPVNAVLLWRSLLALSVRGRRFPTMTRRDSEPRRIAQERLWTALTAQAPSVSVGPDELEPLAAWVRGVASDDAVGILAQHLLGRLFYPTSPRCRRVGPPLSCLSRRRGRGSLRCYGGSCRGSSAGRNVYLRRWWPTISRVLTQ
jgi:hypothetical protein